MAKKNTEKKEDIKKISKKHEVVKQPISFKYIVDIRAPHVVHIYNNKLLADKNLKPYNGKVVRGIAVDYK